MKLVLLETKVSSIIKLLGDDPSHSRDRAGCLHPGLPFGTCRLLRFDLHHPRVVFGSYSALTLSFMENLSFAFKIVVFKSVSR